MAQIGSVATRPNNYKLPTSEDPSTFSYNVKVPIGLNAASFQPAATTSIQLLTFELTQDVINLSRSFLSGNVILTASQVGANFMAMRPPIRTIRLYSPSGQNLVWVDNVAQYQLGPRRYQQARASFAKKVQLDMFKPSQVVKTSVQAINVTPAANPSAASIDYFEPQYLQSTGNGVNMSFPFTLILGDLLGDESLLSMDVSLRFPEKLLLDITFDNQDTWFWGATSQADASVGAVSSTNAVYQMTQVHLNIATEQNVPKQNAVKALCKSGFRLGFPSIQLYRNSVAANVPSMSQDWPLSSGLGSEIRRVYTCFMDGRNNLNWASDIDNQNGLKITNYQTKVNNTPLQQNVLDCTYPSLQTLPSAYDWLKRKGGDSVLFQDPRVWAKSFVHVDDFQNLPPVGQDFADGYQRSMVLGGYPLSGRSGNEQLIYNFTANCPGNAPALQILQWGVFTKTLQFDDTTVTVL